MRKETAELKIREYHAYHEDSVIEICGTVEDRDGYEMWLVKVANKYGVKFAVLHDLHGGYVSEMYSCPMDEAESMVAWYKKQEAGNGD